MAADLTDVLKKHSGEFYPVVRFDSKKDKLLQLDFTAANTELSDQILLDTNAFSKYILQLLGNEYTYGIGGYNEHRTIYSRSRKFDTEDEPRRLHLGIDIWGLATTPVFAPLDSYVHSFAFNDFFGDYGATIILHHELEGITFYTLYGHLSIRDLSGLKEGQYIPKGAEFAHFGELKENGQWPPHLHFQLIADMHGKKGDYRGVCKYSEREKYLSNSPDADLILNMMRYAVKL